MADRAPIRDVDDVTDLGTPCDAPARIHGPDGPITLGRCFRPKGHDTVTPHSAPYDRITWGGPDAAKES